MTTDDPRPVGLAAVGTGAWGANLVRAWSLEPEIDLRWVVDPDQARRARAATTTGARAAADLDRVLDDPEVEVVAIATPAVTHARLALRALEAGRHVFVEKPLALSVADAEALVATAAAADRLLLVGHLLVHHPAVRHVAQLLRDGVLGPLRYVHATRVNLGRVRTDENALWSLAPHDLAVLLELLGRGPVEVAAHGQCYLRDGVEDVVFAHLRFSEGVVAHLHVSWLDPHKVRRLTLVGADKMAVFDDGSPDAKVVVHDKGVVPAPATHGEAMQVRYGDVHIPRISPAEPLGLECRHVARAVRRREEPRADGTQGLAVVRVLDALQRSLEGGGRPVAPEATAGPGVVQPS